MKKHFHLVLIAVIGIVAYVSIGRATDSVNIQPTFPATIADGSITGAKFVSNIAISTTGNIATTGNLSGKIMILDNVSGPTAAQMYGSLNVISSNITVTLPTAVAGMSGCILDTGTAHDIIVDVQATDNIALLGALDTGGDGITPKVFCNVRLKNVAS